MKVNCQRITHVGCCIKRKPRENIKVCVNFSRTSYQQATDRLPTHHQQSADCRPTDDQLSADCRPTVDRQSADRFFGELFFTITDIIYEPSTQPPSLPVAVIVKFDSFSGPSLADSMPSCVPITPITATV